MSYTSQNDLSLHPSSITSSVFRQDSLDLTSIQSCSLFGADNNDVPDVPDIPQHIQFQWKANGEGSIDTTDTSSNKNSSRYVIYDRENRNLNHGVTESSRTSTPDKTGSGCSGGISEQDPRSMQTTSSDGDSASQSSDQTSGTGQSSLLCNDIVTVQDFNVDPCVLGFVADAPDNENAQEETVIKTFRMCLVEEHQTTIKRKEDDATTVLVSTTKELFDRSVEEWKNDIIQKVIHFEENVTKIEKEFLEENYIREIILELLKYGDGKLVAYFDSRQNKILLVCAKEDEKHAEDVWKDHGGITSTELRDINEDELLILRLHDKDMKLKVKVDLQAMPVRLQGLQTHVQSAIFKIRKVLQNSHLAKFTMEEYAVNLYKSPETQNEVQSFFIQIENYKPKWQVVNNKEIAVVCSSQQRTATVIDCLKHFFNKKEIPMPKHCHIDLGLLKSKCDFIELTNKGLVAVRIDEGRSVVVVECAGPAFDKVCQNIEHFLAENVTTLILRMGRIEDTFPMVDVKVNTTGLDLKLDVGHVSKDMANVGGPKAQASCRQKYPDGIKYGDLAITDPGNLPCKQLFHVSLPTYETNGSIQSLKESVKKCLQKADEMGYSTIAFPAIGTGTLKFPAAEAAGAFFDVIKAFKLNRDREVKLKTIYIILLSSDTTTVQAFYNRGREEQKDDPSVKLE